VKGKNVLLKLTMDEDQPILVNFDNVLTVELGTDENEGFSMITLLEEVCVYVKEDLDYILSTLASLRR